eukprot:1182284-Prorocentrum_minimum.AAC.5
MGGRTWSGGCPLKSKDNRSILALRRGLEHGWLDRRTRNTFGRNSFLSYKTSAIVVAVASGSGSNSRSGREKPCALSEVANMCASMVVSKGSLSSSQRLVSTNQRLVSCALRLVSPNQRPVSPPLKG